MARTHCISLKVINENMSIPGMVSDDSMIYGQLLSGDEHSVAGSSNNVCGEDLDSSCTEEIAPRSNGMGVFLIPPNIGKRLKPTSQRIQRLQHLRMASCPWC